MQEVFGFPACSKGPKEHEITFPKLTTAGGLHEAYLSIVHHSGVGRRSGTVHGGNLAPLKIILQEVKSLKWCKITLHPKPCTPNP